MITTLAKVLIGILAVGLGVLLGLPGRGGRSAPGEGRWRIRGPGSPGVHDEEELRQLERDLGRTTALRRRAKRYFTPLDLLRRERRGSHRRRTRRYFRTAAPTDRGRGG